jgi:hypothetical protein
MAALLPTFLQQLAIRPFDRKIATFGRYLFMAQKLKIVFLV